MSTFLVGFFHLEDIADFLLSTGFPLGVPLDLMQLLHLQMLHRTDVVQHLQLGTSAEVAEGAAVTAALLHDGVFRDTQVPEQHVEDLVPLVGGVQLQLVYAVGVVLAQVAPHVHWVGVGEELELPLVTMAALQDVVDVLQLLEVLVRLAVQLEVGLEIGLV